MFFDGDYKQRRPINLGGKNTTSNPTSLRRADLLKHVEEERLKRELHRRKLEATLHIQAFCRSKLHLRDWANKERQAWDLHFQHCLQTNQLPLEAEQFILLCRPLVFFFKSTSNVDDHRLFSLIQHSNIHSLSSLFIPHPALFRKLTSHIFSRFKHMPVDGNETLISFVLSLVQHQPSLLHNAKLIIPMEQYLQALLSSTTMTPTPSPPFAIPKSFPSLMILMASIHPTLFSRHILSLPGLLTLFSPSVLLFLKKNFPLPSLLKNIDDIYPTTTTTTTTTTSRLQASDFLTNFLGLTSYQLSKQPASPWTAPYFELVHRCLTSVSSNALCSLIELKDTANHQPVFAVLFQVLPHVPHDALLTSCAFVSLVLASMPAAFAVRGTMLPSPPSCLASTLALMDPTLPCVFYDRCVCFYQKDEGGIDTSPQRPLAVLVKDAVYVCAVHVVADLLGRCVATLPDTDAAHQLLAVFPELSVFITLVKNIVVHALYYNWSVRDVVMDTLVALLQLVYSKRSIRSLCGTAEYWLATDVVLDPMLLLTETLPAAPGTPVSQASMPMQRLLTDIPFVVPFHDRVRLFRYHVRMDRQHGPAAAFMVFHERHPQFEIRRDYLFEDSYQQLHKLGAGLKSKIGIVFKNEFGVAEEGIDGGGVFKEFLNELAKHAFHPSFKLFELTNNNELYPSIHSLNQLKYYEFLGLILGKALYEGILLETVFAPFFLNKWIGKQNFLDDLPDLDPDLYKNLLFLRQCDNVENLALNFSITYQENEQMKTVDLIPDGRNIPVDNANKIKYIYLVADFKLNSLIQAQSNALLSGLAKLIEPEWLRMFNQDELGILLSGSKFSLDLADMRKNTVYSGGYFDKHPVIEAFWKVASEMTEEDKRSLLCFITSCTRAPLLGFKELNPLICIRNAGTDQERLPTSSTCINLLKLPEFQSEELLKKKLLYSLRSKAGFELS